MVSEINLFWWLGRTPMYLFGTVILDTNDYWSNAFLFQHSAQRQKVNVCKIPVDNPYDSVCPGVFGNEEIASS